MGRDDRRKAADIRRLKVSQTRPVPTLDEQILLDRGRCGRDFDRSGRRPEECAGLQRGRARARPEYEAIAGHYEHRPLLSIAEPAEHRGDQ
jgi:hypothetical protein